MAKATRHSGPSYTEHELSDPNPPPQIQRAMLGDDLQSVGTDLSESSESESPLETGSNQAPQEPAHTTENPSDQTEREGTDADTTDTGGRSSSKATATRTSRKKAQTRAVDDDDF